MQKEFVTYDLALRMKALGYKEPCFGRWWFRADMHKLNEQELEIISSNYFELPEHYILAPTFSQAFRWFREKFEGVQFEIVPSHWKHKYTGFYHITAGFLNLETMEMSYSVGAGGFETYEEAELACLIKLIELLEQY